MNNLAKKSPVCFKTVADAQTDLVRRYVEIWHEDGRRPTLGGLFIRILQAEGLRRADIWRAVDRLIEQGVVSLRNDRKIMELIPPQGLDPVTVAGSGHVCACSGGGGCSGGCESHQKKMVAR